MIATPGQRIEQDSLGAIEVPSTALWGIHTQRALANFEVSGIPVGTHRPLVRALALVKQAAALANHELGLLPTQVADAIVAACQRVAAGELDEHFPVDVVQGGAGTSTNLNANEVIANLALLSLGHPAGSYQVVHPIEHVNRCQSTNDVYPTAVRLALCFALEGLMDRLDELAEAFAERGRAFADVPKLGRTQLQDAVPMTLGREFAAFGVAIAEEPPRLRESIGLLCECSLGATAIGTGVTAHPGYRELAVAHLAALTGLPLVGAADLIEANWDVGAFVHLSGVLKRTAIKLTKICNDLRLLSSGPEAGLAEIRLPARQVGSSIMPGKVNPVIPEVVNQIVFFVVGADLTVTLAAENGQLQLNAFEPAIAHALLTSISWLTKGCDLLTRHCVTGIEANEAELRRRAQADTAVATGLVPLLGYETVAQLTHQAVATGRPLLELATDLGLVDADTHLIRPESVRASVSSSPAPELW